MAVGSIALSSRVGLATGWLVQPMGRTLALPMSDLDPIAGIVKAVPKKAINKVVDAGLQALSPITAPLGGIGKLIEARFERWTEIEKINSAKAIEEAKKRALAPATQKALPSGRVMIAAMESVAVETDPGLRELWINLLANELSSRQVHPIFPKILAELSPTEAHLLTTFTDETTFKKATRSLLDYLTKVLVKVEISYPRIFETEHLESLGLIGGSPLRLTATGEAFIAAVSDPSIAAEAEEARSEGEET